MLSVAEGVGRAGVRAGCLVLLKLTDIIRLATVKTNIVLFL